MSMEIACACDYGDGEPIWPVSIEIVTARKAHGCVECGLAINPGEKAELIKGKCEGEWMREYTCLVCVRIRRDYGCTIGTLREDIAFCLGIDYVTGEQIPNWEAP